MAMIIKSFEEIIAWQKARELAKEIYKLCNPLKDYGFRDQLQRAAVSIMNNIAEGFERQSNKELKQFLFIAKGSSGEVRSMLYLSSELGYVSNAMANELNNKTMEISRLLSGFIKTL